MDLTLTVLRVVREVADAGSFTTAAGRLGYTQSAVSRQVLSAERELGARLFDRVRGGVRPTEAGRVVVRQATIALAALDDAVREIGGPAVSVTPVRLGYFAAAGTGLVPRAIGGIARSRPQVEVSTREVTTPAAVRALRAGTLDVALVTSRPPHRALDQLDPALVTLDVGELRLALAVSAVGRFGGRESVAAEELAGVSWISSPGSSDEPLLGTWPGLPHSPSVRHAARDWAAKLALVASGAGVTTVPGRLLEVPSGVEVVDVTGVPEEARRLVLAGRPDLDADLLAALAEELRRARPRTTGSRSRARLRQG